MDDRNDGEPDPRQHTLRRTIVHMIEEYARHCGHADLLREAIDGIRAIDRRRAETFREPVQHGALVASRRRLARSVAAHGQGAPRAPGCGRQ